MHRELPLFFSPSRLSVPVHPDAFLLLRFVSAFGGWVAMQRLRRMGVQLEVAVFGQLVLQMPGRRPRLPGAGAGWRPSGSEAPPP